jgi:hypothetical protein
MTLAAATFVAAWRSSKDVTIDVRGRPLALQRREVEQI